MGYLLRTNTNYKHQAKKFERAVLTRVGRDGSEMAISRRRFLLVSAYKRARMAFTSSLACSVMSPQVRNQKVAGSRFDSRTGNSMLCP